MNESVLPSVHLETYILLPFQVVSSHDDVKAGQFRENLGNSDLWERAEHIHDTDAISAVGLNADDKARIRYQAYNYFHPFVRSFWYDNDLVQRFRHRKLKTLKTCFYGLQEPIEFTAVADLYHFLPDIGILVLHLQSNKPLPLKNAQDCLDRLRRIYPPYIGGGGAFGGHYPDTVELLDEQGGRIGHYENKQIESLLAQAQQCEDKQRGKNRDENKAAKTTVHSHVMASHWAALLCQLGSQGAYSILQLGDDRAALVSKIDIEHGAHPFANTPLVNLIDRGNMIRLCFADASGSDRLPYAQRYMAEFEQRYCYDRFWYQDGESGDAASRIMNCGYAFTWLGSGKDTGFFTHAKDGAPVTFRHIYLPMAIIAHFQKAALLVAARRLADLSPYGANGEPGKLDAKVFKKIEANFIAFTQTYWFDEITPQEQGIELFEMWQRMLKTRLLYQEHRQELQDIVAFINGQEEEKQTIAAWKLNRYGAYAAVASLVIAYVSMMTGVLGMNPLGIDEFPNWLDQGIKFMGLIAFSVLSGILLFAVFMPVLLYLFPGPTIGCLRKTLTRIKGKFLHANPPPN
ncbi:MAG: hypothetical protein RLZZ352_1707 [Pseudomonadota bacterium]|jgi:hypothetical protein